MLRFITFIILFGLSHQCALHDVLESSPSSRSSQHYVQIDNQTMRQIFQNSSQILSEIGGNGGQPNSLLVQLNQTSANVSTLALIVKNGPHGGNDQDILKRFRMYYVTLREEQLNGYRVYMKMLTDYFRNHISSVMGALWSPVKTISRFWSQQQQNPDHLSNTIQTLSLPIMLKALNLPADFEKLIIEFGSEPEDHQKKADNQTETINNNNSTTNDSSSMNDNNEEDGMKNKAEESSIQQMAKRFLMRIISAFTGQIKPNKQAMKNGLLITDKGLRIDVIGEQMADGQVDLYIDDSKQ